MKTAPMAGKSWQPSHEPPHSKRSRHLSHCRNSGKREGKGGGGGRRTAWAMSCHAMKLKGTPPVCMPCYAMLQSTRMWNSDTCAYVSTSLTSRGTHVHLSKFRSKNLKASLMSSTHSLISVKARCLSQSQRVLNGNFNKE